MVSANSRISATKTKPKRPNGVDEDRYKGINSWSYRKWSWEFLRRNAKFIAACNRVKGGSEFEKQKVAASFGLRKFKDYRESYRSGAGIPKYEIGSIRSWSSLELNKKETVSKTIKLKSGQVLICFDLAAAIKDKRALDKQLSRASARLEKRLQEYSKITQQVIKSHKAKAMNFGAYIRLLDGTNAGKKPIDCAKLVFKGRAEMVTDHYLRQAVKSPLEAANDLAREGYLYLSLLDDKPTTKAKKILLQL